MQIIRVKEVRGPLGRGERQFYAVVADDGAEFTTFDTKIQSITPGSILSIEPKVEVKGGKTYVNIVKWEVKEAGAPARAASAPSDLEALRLELLSRERLGILQALLEYRGRPGIPFDGKIPAILNAALDWAESRFKVEKPAQPASPSKERGEELSADELKNMTFANRGEFYDACYKRWRWQKSKTDSEVADYNLDDPEQRRKAWPMLLSVHAEPPEEER